MKNIVRILVTVAVCALISGQARASIIALWNFSSSTASTYNYVSSAPTFSSSGGSAAEAISGGTLNYTVNGTASKLNNTVLTFTLAPINATISGLSVQYKAYSGQGLTLSGTWAYSINGAGFNNIGTAGSIAIAATAPATDNNTFTLSGVSIAPADTSLVFRLTLSGASSVSSNPTLNFDDMEFDATSAVPEPTTYALAVFGLMFAGVGAGRFYISRRRLATVK